MRFKLRTLLIAILGICLLLGWFASLRSSAKRQRRAVQAIEKAGGHVVYDYEYDGEGYAKQGASPPAPAWLLALLGDDFFADVVAVLYIKKNGHEGAILHHLAELPDLKSVDLCGTNTTDHALGRIGDLKHLERLLLNKTKVSDTLLPRVARLKRLQDLKLRGTLVTDVGLECLHDSINLFSLDLGDTAITDAGLGSLRRLTQLRKLELSGTGVSDTGLPLLSGLNQLDYLGLCDTNVTDAGVAQLCRLTRLKRLQLFGTKITVDGVEQLRLALPRCKVDFQ
jgi:hypothetical protein